jgi:hypothetical protein
MANGPCAAAQNELVIGSLFIPCVDMKWEKRRFTMSKISYLQEAIKWT